MTGPLFVQYEIPGANALTAGSFDASVSFDASMPISHVAYSLGVLGMYLSPAPNARPDAIAVGGQAPAPSPCPEGEVPYTDILGFKHCGKQLHSNDESL